jgi:BirA family transcriptional regulator, biotin operon repressor / biotin---[acetyl-CoA-carboxylase] ligase
VTEHVAGDLRLPPAYRLVALDSVDSTNEEAKRRARAGAEDGTLVWARAQTHGRGRGGRSWASPPGNLYLSLVLQPDCAPADAAQLSFVAALGAGAALGEVVPPMVEVTYKWPNDILLNRRKAGGILLETESVTRDRLDWLVLGVGINVATHPSEAVHPATSLRNEGADDVTVEMLLEAFARHFLSWVNRWLDDGFEPVRLAWREQARGIGAPVQVRLPNAELAGTFEDIDADGALLLRRADQSLQRVTAGDVFFGDKAGAGM